LDIRIRLQTHYPAGYPTGKQDSDHLWARVARAQSSTLWQQTTEVTRQDPSITS